MNINQINVPRRTRGNLDGYLSLLHLISKPHHLTLKTAPINWSVLFLYHAEAIGRPHLQQMSGFLITAIWKTVE
jgi:hypothetical protein